MPSTDSSRDALLERLSEEFVERYRRGERPALAEYTERYPHWAERIRALERLKDILSALPGLGDPA